MARVNFKWDKIYEEQRSLDAPNYCREWEFIAVFKKCEIRVGAVYRVGATGKFQGYVREDPGKDLEIRDLLSEAKKDVEEFFKGKISELTEFTENRGIRKEISET
jgi:hypothetical protein